MVEIQKAYFRSKTWGVASLRRVQIICQLLQEKPEL